MSGRRRAAPVALALALALAPAAAGVQVDDPFQAATVRVSGRPLQLLAADLSGRCEAGARDWVAVSSSGTPPDEVRRLSFFPCIAGGGLAAEPVRVIEVPPDVVAFDLADADGVPGDELVLLSAEALHVRTPLRGGAGRVVPLPERVPLPPRVRGLSRMDFVDTWNGDGVPAALVPTSTGALLVSLPDGKARRLSLPLVSEYETFDTRPPAHDEVLTTETVWPALALVHDDADEREDLVAASRYAVWIFRSGEDGLPEEPTRIIPLHPFSAEEELRHETTALRIFAQDVDGDGLGDLLVDTGAGSLAASHHLTEIHLNRGDGVALTEPSRIELAQGIGSVRLHDLDGDGRSEIVYSRLTFGILQLVRILISRRVDAELEVYALSDEPGAPPRSTFETELALAVDLDRGHAADLLPLVDGDWNGDGRLDLLYGQAGEGLAIRLGEAGEAGPSFGRRIASQPLPAPGTDLVVAADFDGDGLDDLILADSHDTEGRIYVLRNRGILPGTRPGIRRAPDGTEPGGAPVESEPRANAPGAPGPRFGDPGD